MCYSCGAKRPVRGAGAGGTAAQGAGAGATAAAGTVVRVGAPAALHPQGSMTLQAWVRLPEAAGQDHAVEDCDLVVYSDGNNHLVLRVRGGRYECGMHVVPKMGTRREKSEATKMEAAAPVACGVSISWP